MRNFLISLLCFAIGIGGFLISPNTTEIESIESDGFDFLCTPIDSAETEYALIINASDYSPFGDGSPQNPFIIDTGFLNYTLQHLPANHNRIVINGGCHTYLFEGKGKTVIVPNNSLITRFDIKSDNLHPVFDISDTDVEIKDDLLDP